MKPLADKIRPETMEDIVGQEHLIGKNKILNRIINSGEITNMIFYGPPGTGKTTLANIIAKKTNKTFYKLNATNASVKDIKDIIGDINTFMTMKGILLYLDEIQNFNKKQQQSLLEFMENGTITLIASTTENPYFYVYNAILSRSTIFEFKPLIKNDIVKAINRAIRLHNEEGKKIKFEEIAIEYIAEMSSGDVRKALNAVELAINSTRLSDSTEIVIGMDIAKDCTQKKILNYDKNGDNHYDILSAFQKSIRGSDVDAAIHYLARLVIAGDLISICRRLLVIAAEDIGLSYPSAMSIVKSCTDAALQLGFPEARIPLSEAVILLAVSPKSNSAICAIDAAIDEINKKDVGEIPLHLRDGHYAGAAKLGHAIEYKYPHNFENHYIKQQYLPSNIKNSIYYVAGENKQEQSAVEYWSRIKKS